MPEVVESAVQGNLTYSIQELDNTVSALLKAAGSCRVWLFTGELGAGKTTLIKSLCQRLGVSGAMSSPGFSIVNEYAGAAGPVFHFDFYRLKKEEEAFDIGVDEYLDSGNYCLIEWPDRIPTLIPAQHFSVVITITGPAQRFIEFQLHE